MKCIFILTVFFHTAFAFSAQQTMEFDLIEKSVTDIYKKIQDILKIQDSEIAKITEAELQLLKTISNEDIFNTVELRSEELSQRKISYTSGLYSAICKHFMPQFTYYDTKDQKYYTPKFIHERDDQEHVMQKMNIYQYLIMHPNVQKATEKTSVTPFGTLCKCYIMLAEIIKHSKYTLSDKYIYCYTDGRNLTSIALQFELNEAYDYNCDKLDVLFLPIHINLPNEFGCSCRVGTAYCSQKDTLEIKLSNYEKLTDTTKPSETIEENAKNTTNIISTRRKKRKKGKKNPLYTRILDYRTTHDCLFDIKYWNDTLLNDFEEAKKCNYIQSDFKITFDENITTGELRKEIINSHTKLKEIIAKYLNKKYVKDNDRLSEIETTERNFLYGLKDAANFYKSDKDILKLLYTAIRYNIASLQSDSINFSKKDISEALASSTLTIEKELKEYIRKYITALEGTDTFTKDDLERHLLEKYEKAKIDDALTRLVSAKFQDYRFVLHSSFFDFVVEYMACGILESFYQYPKYWYDTVVPQILTSLHMKLCAYEQKRIESYPIHLLLCTTAQKAYKDGLGKRFNVLDQATAARAAANIIDQQETAASIAEQSSAESIEKQMIAAANIGKQVASNL